MDNVEIKNDAQSVKFVPAICPKCGGKMEVDPSQEAAVCQYCGSAFIVDKAVQNYTIQNAHIDHADKVTVDLKGSVDSVIGLVEREMDKSREERREEKREFDKSSLEFFKNSWRIYLVLFGVLIIMWIIANAFGFFN